MSQCKYTLVGADGFPIRSQSQRARWKNAGAFGWRAGALAHLTSLSRRHATRIESALCSRFYADNRNRNEWLGWLGGWLAGIASDWPACVPASFVSRVGDGDTVFLFFGMWWVRLWVNRWKLNERTNERTSNTSANDLFLLSAPTEWRTSVTMPDYTHVLIRLLRMWTPSIVFALLLWTYWRSECCNRLRHGKRSTSSICRWMRRYRVNLIWRVGRMDEFQSVVDGVRWGNGKYKGTRFQ